MKNAGHNVEILTPHSSSEIKELEEIKVKCFSTRGPPGLVAFRLIKEALIGKYDLFYCHELDPLLYSLILKRLTKKPILWDCHEYLIPMKKELQGNLAAVLTEIGLKIAAPRVNHIVTVDNFLALELARWRPVTVIPNYPTINNFSKSKDLKPKEKPNLLYVGGLTRKRGLKIMLKAFKIAKESLDLSFTIVGGFDDKKLEKWALDYDKENGLEIKWLGWVHYTELAPIITKASLGLSLLQPVGKRPRYSRAIPTKVFEYLTMGVPILTSKGPLLEKITKKGKCGVCVDPTDINQISEKIIQLVEKNELTEMGRRGKEFVTGKFVWEAREKNLLKIIDKLTTS